MGTRNLTMVVSGGQTKVAQYGQFDGYPSGQGSKALLFLRKADMAKFKEKIEKIRFLTKEEIEKLEGTDWETSHPQLNRDHAAEILEMIYEGNITTLSNSESFAGESLFCEWAYVIDLDKNTFEVYQGFNKTPLSENERFFNTPLSSINDEYFQVKHLVTFNLDSLPTVDQFIDKCNSLDPYFEADDEDTEDVADDDELEEGQIRAKILVEVDVICSSEDIRDGSLMMSEWDSKVHGRIDNFGYCTIKSIKSSIKEE